MTTNAEISGVGKSKKEYKGEYPAQVVSVNDPKELMRVQVRVVDLFAEVLDKDLPWAEYKFPVGVRPNAGLFVPCQIGDWVWTDFPHKFDTRRPRITSGMHFCPDGIPNLPHEAWNGPNKYTHERVSPPQLTPTAAGYHRDVVCAQHGVLIEIVQDTSEVRVTQKISGSAVEIDADGNITAHSEANLYGSSKENTEIDVDGDLEARVGGKVLIEAVGDVDVTTDGDATVVVGAEATIEAPTKVTLTTPSLEVSGNISSGGDIVAASGNITDSVGTMVKMRAVYNTHTHPENDSAPSDTNAPSQPME